jgi:hypothetical protein
MNVLAIIVSADMGAEELAGILANAPDLEPLVLALKPKPALDGMTCQQVIEVIYKAAAVVGVPKPSVWQTQVVAAGLAWLADRRSRVYDGPRVEQLHMWTPEFKRTVLSIIKDKQS